MTDDEIEALLSTALRDGAVAWPQVVTDDTAEKIITLADFHGVASLLHSRLARSAGVPSLVQEGLRDCAIGWAMRDLGERQVLARLIPAFHKHGVRPLFFKGTALAYSHYADPAFRQRADTDILVSEGERAAAHAALTDLGWGRILDMGAEVSRHQASYSLDGPGDATFHIDLHWRISNSAVLHPLFEHDALWGRSIPLTSLHPQARGAHPVDSLLIACMHRLVHQTTPYYSDGVARLVPDRLIWLNDICLLSDGFSPEDWAEFTRRAGEKGLASSCRDGLSRAKALLSAQFSEPVLEALAQHGSTAAPDAYLRASWARREWMDFMAIRGASGKLQFIAEIIFPPADYMRRHYSGDGWGWLPWLYLRRAIGGVSKRLRGRPGPASPP